MKQIEEKLKVAVSENELLLKNNKKLTNQISQLTSQLNNQKLKNEHQMHVHHKMDDVAHIELSGQLAQFQEFKIYEKDQEIKKLSKQMEEKNSEISKLRALLSLSHSELTITDSKFENQINDLASLKIKISQLERENDQLLLEKKMEGQFRIELEHLRAENHVFQTLLGFTPSLENQGDYEHNPKTVPLKNIKDKKYPITPSNKVFDYCHNCNREIYLYRSCCNPLQQLNDKLLYVPGDAYNFAQSFKSKYLQTKNDLETDELLEILLFELNKIWQDREKNHLQLLAKHCKDRINQLQRTHSGKISYDEKQTLQQLTRLKKQIKDLQRENLDYFNNKFSNGTVKL